MPASSDYTVYEFTLFVNGASGLSARAIANVRKLCDSHLGGHCRLSILDIHENPDAALESQVVAVPTLVRNQPPPLRRVVGDLSQTDRVLRVLDLPPAIPAGPSQER